MPGPRPLFAKTAYRGLGRAVLPVSGWYEWAGAGRRKARWRIAAPGRPVLLVAAVWDLWTAPDGGRVASLATVTCAPSAEVAAVHDRMPAILAPDGLPVWLGEAEGNPSALLGPLSDGALRVEPG